MNKVLTIIATLSLIASTSIAQTNLEKKDTNLSIISDSKSIEDNDNWILLGKHSNAEYFLQKDSLKILTYDIGKILRMTMQTNDNKSIYYSNLFFWVNSCKQKQGELVYATLSNTEFKTSMVVVGGKDVGSKAATIMCNDLENFEAHLSTMSEQEMKENSEWKDIAGTDQVITSYKINSFESSDINNKPSVSVLGRVIDLNTKNVSLQKWSTSKSDCKLETGVLHTYDIKSKTNTSNNYSFYSGSMASLIAEDLCKLSKN